MLDFFRNSKIVDLKSDRAFTIPLINKTDPKVFNMLGLITLRTSFEIKTFVQEHMRSFNGNTMAPADENLLVLGMYDIWNKVRFSAWE